MLRALACVLLLASLGACTTPREGIPVPRNASEYVPPASACMDENDWNEATPPRHVFGNTWYVGSCGISAILITSPQGHILIDAATDEAAPGVARAIEATGVRLHDVRVILNTHEHFDHAGGIAALQKATGAKVLARHAALDALRSGRSTRDDAQHLELKAFPGNPGVQAIADDAVVRVGPLQVQAHATPGHAPGGTSWSWRSCEGSDCRQIVYADSVSAISDDVYRYREHPAHVAAFRDSMKRIAAISPCDILLTPHPGGSDLWPRLYGLKPMATPGACRAYAATGEGNMDTRLKKEATGTPP